ncbi:hypothetical protein ES703_66248 [subsurface metagenome]
MSICFLDLFREHVRHLDVRICGFCASGELVSFILTVDMSMGHVCYTLALGYLCCRIAMKMFFLNTL